MRGRDIACAAMVMVGVWLCIARDAAAQPSGSFAQPSDAYLALIREAVAESGRGNHAEARALFERAHSIRPNARTLRGLGITAFELKRYAQARRDLQAAMSDARQPLTEAQRAEAGELIARAESYLGTVKIKLTPGQAELYLDGHRVQERSLVLDIGEYRLSAHAPGFHDAEWRVIVEGAKKIDIELALQAVVLVPTRDVRDGAWKPERVSTAPRPPSDADDSMFQRWWFWVAVGVVAAAGTTAAVVIATDQSSDGFEKGDVGGVVHALQVAP